MMQDPWEDRGKTPSVPDWKKTNEVLSRNNTLEYMQIKTDRPRAQILKELIEQFKQKNRTREEPKIVVNPADQNQFYLYLSSEGEQRFQRQVDGTYQLTKAPPSVKFNPTPILQPKTYRQTFEGLPPRIYPGFKAEQNRSGLPPAIRPAMNNLTKITPLGYHQNLFGRQNVRNIQPSRHFTYHSPLPSPSPQPHTFRYPADLHAPFLQSRLHQQITNHFNNPPLHNQFVQNLAPITFTKPYDQTIQIFSSEIEEKKQFGNFNVAIQTSNIEPYNNMTSSSFRSARQLNQKATQTSDIKIHEPFISQPYYQQFRRNSKVRKTIFGRKPVAEAVNQTDCCF